MLVSCIIELKIAKIQVEQYHVTPNFFHLM